MSNERRYKSVELYPVLAGRFSEVCRDYHITFEPSQCFNMVHFEVLVNDEETALLNDWLNNATA